MSADEVWREEEEVDAHNAQPWELIVLCRTLCCVWDRVLAQTWYLFLLRSERWRMGSIFCLFPPSPGWPFGNLAKKRNSKLEAKGRQNILYVLSSSPPSAGSASFSVCK